MGINKGNTGITMTPQRPNKKRILIIGIATAAVVAASIFVLLQPKEKKDDSRTTGPTTVYHDPTSGEDIVNQQGKTPEQTLTSPTTPLYAGFDKLLNSGMTLTQVQTLYAAFESYKPFASNKVQISLAADDIQPVRPQDSDPLYRWSIKSHVVVNRTTTYKVQIYYWGIDNVQLLLGDQNGTQIFDSGPIGSDFNTGD